jgi:hypothetical protein
MSLKKLSLAGALGCAAFAANVFASMPAKAACISPSSTTNCSTFSQSSASLVRDYAYTDGDFVGNNTLTEIKFYQNGFTSGLPITLTDIAYSIDGGTNWLTDNLSATTYTITSGFTSDGSATNLLTAPVGSPTYAATSNFTLRFTIPATPALTPADGTKRITSFVANETSPGGATPQTQTRQHSLVTSTSVPGPLPIFGAAAAFGYSRKIRKAIRAAG